MSTIGPVIAGGDVEAAMEATVRLWSPDYLAEVAEQHGRARGDLAEFRSYVHMVDVSKYSEDQTPTCVIVSPGTSEHPERSKTDYGAWWSVGLGAVVSGQDVQNTYELVGLYIAAMRALVIQHKSLGGFASDTVWMAERYDEIASDDARTIMAGVAQFDVYVEAVTKATGPTKPSADATLPPGEWPTAETVTVSTTARS
jgi:hypothetical protein